MLKKDKSNRGFRRFVTAFLSLSNEEVKPRALASEVVWVHLSFCCSRGAAPVSLGSLSHSQKHSHNSPKPALATATTGKSSPASGFVQLCP